MLQACPLSSDTVQHIRSQFHLSIWARLRCWPSEVGPHLDDHLVPGTAFTMGFILLWFPSFISSLPRLIQPNGGIRLSHQSFTESGLPRPWSQCIWATCTTSLPHQGEAGNHVAASERPSFVITPSLLCHKYSYKANYFPLEWGRTGTGSCFLLIPSPGPGSMNGWHSINSLGELRKSHVLSLSPPSVASFEFWRRGLSANRKGGASSSLPIAERLCPQWAWTCHDKTPLWTRPCGFWPSVDRCFPGGAKEPACQHRRCKWCPGGEDPLEEGMATHSSILAWRIPWTEEPASVRVGSMGSQRVRHDWATEQQLQGKQDAHLPPDGQVPFSLPRIFFFNKT